MRNTLLMSLRALKSPCRKENRDDGGKVVMKDSKSTERYQDTG